MAFEIVRQSVATHLSSETLAAWNPLARYRRARENYLAARAVEREFEDELLDLLAAGAIDLNNPNPLFQERAKRAYEAECATNTAEGRLIGAMTLAGIDSEKLHQEIVEDIIDSSLNPKD